MNFSEQFMQKHLPSRMPRGISPLSFIIHSRVTVKRQVKKSSESLTPLWDFNYSVETKIAVETVHPTQTYSSPNIEKYCLEVF